MKDEKWQESFFQDGKYFHERNKGSPSSEHKLEEVKPKKEVARGLHASEVKANRTEAGQ